MDMMIPYNMKNHNTTFCFIRNRYLRDRLRHCNLPRIAIKIAPSSAQMRVA
jgi:hypothetical protein